MKNDMKRKSVLAVILSLMLMCTAFAGGMMLSGRATADNTPAAPVSDPSPAIAVAQKTASSVVGVSSYVQRWDRTSGETVDQLYSQGSGVVIADGGYILTNYHVIESCNSFKILMPDGEYVDAEIAGTDSSTDLAVLHVLDRADELTPVEIGTTADLLVGSTVVAIGNPGGEALANTVTQGIVSALERNVSADNTSRQIKYVQHDAAINNGNSGGGLFNAAGQLVGINTLKYSGSAYSSVSFEGLGFAIPVDTAYPIAMDLIEYGEVQRAQLGIMATSWPGPDEPMPSDPPASVMVAEVLEGGGAEAAGLQMYDFITEIDGVRVSDMAELTTELDKHSDGDVVSLTVVRYSDLNAISSLYAYYFGNSQDNSMYGNGSIFGNTRGSNRSGRGTAGFETLTIEVTLHTPVHD